MTDQHDAEVAAVPPSVLGVIRRADRPDAGPQPGELWRARPPGAGPATLVWVRTVSADAVVAVPVTFDVDMADERTLIIDADSSPFGVPVAVFVAIESTLDPATFIDRLGSVDDTTGSLTGTSVTSPLDARTEYRQALVDEMATLAAASPEADADLQPDSWDLVDGQSGRAALLMAIHEALGGTHPAARIAPRPATSSGSEQLGARALVAELDAFVLVASVDPALDADRLLDAVRQALQADQLLNAVCVVEPDPPFLSIVIDRRDVVEAIETPSGELRPPRQSRPRVALGDALVKFLDTTISPFGQLVGTVVGGQAMDPRALAVDVGGEAVRSVEASARGFKAEGKRPGYERVGRHRASIVRLVEAALSGTEVDVGSIMEDDT